MDSVVERVRARRSAVKAVANLLVHRASKADKGCLSSSKEEEQAATFVEELRLWSDWSAWGDR